MFLIICIFLIFIPIYNSPASEVGVAVIIVVSGIPVYFSFIWWQSKPKLIQRFSGNAYNHFGNAQKFYLFLSFVPVALDNASALFFKGVQEESSKTI